MLIYVTQAIADITLATSIQPTVWYTSFYLNITSVYEVWECLRLHDLEKRLFSLTHLCLWQYDELDRRWHRPHVASACYQEGESLLVFIKGFSESSYTYMFKLAYTECVVTIFVPSCRTQAVTRFRTVSNLSAANTNTGTLEHTGPVNQHPVALISGSYIIIHTDATDTTSGYTSLWSLDWKLFRDAEEQLWVIVKDIAFYGQHFVFQQRNAVNGAPNQTVVMWQDETFISLFLRNGQWWNIWKLQALNS